jgi:hypothetical protein
VHGNVIIHRVPRDDGYREMEIVTPPALLAGVSYADGKPAKTVARRQT